MSEWYWVTGIIGIVLAVIAEVDIRMHRRDHERRQNAWREGDPQ